MAFEIRFIQMDDVKSQDQNMHSFKPDELELWLGFLADAFGNKHPNMLELFQMMPYG